MKKIAVKDIKNRIAAFFKRLPQTLKEAPPKAAARYKKWLYAEKKEKSAAPGRAGALIIGAALLLFGLYYIGVYDFDLLERPEAWKDNPERLFSIWRKEAPEESDGDESADTGGDEGEAGPDTVKSVEIEFQGRSTRPGGEGAGISAVFKTREELAAEGYYLTDATFDPASSTIGKIDFSFSLPSEFSYRDMATRYWNVTTHTDGVASTVEDTVTRVERPAIYLYMGYVIYDDRGKALYLIDRNGAVLMNYNENYLPAFARDRAGNPLFYTTYNYYADVPASYEVDKYGEETYTYKSAYLTGKNYYTLSYGGNYFVSSDYIEERDGRGLNFDFPASYGLTDSAKLRIGIMSPKYSTFLDGHSDYVNFMNWNYYYPYDAEKPVLADILKAKKEYEEKKIEEIAKKKAEETAESTETATGTADTAADTAPETNADGTPKEPKEEEFKISNYLPYSAAFNYREGYATVVTDKVDEEARYHVEEVRVINAAGDVMFNSQKKYQNKILNAYCSDRFMLPLSKGEESIGHIYFDHGYMRLRKVSYDPFQLKEFKVFRVNMDTDVLVSPNGREFPIPEGYTLKGYSDGVLTLERGGVFGYMNVDGIWISEPMYKNAAAFHGGLGVLTRKDGTCGVVDTTGTIIIPFRYSYISNRSDGLIAAYSESEGWVLYGVFAK